MAVFDRIKTTTTSTTSPFVVSTTPPTGYLGFSKFSNGATDIPVAIVHQTANEWQVCYCSWNSATNELTVTSVLLSTNADAAVTFSAGTKDVFVTASSRSVGHLREINTWTANNYFNGGNVGIGTASPASQLHVVSATNFQPQIIADHVAGAGTGAAYFILDRARGTPSARTAVVSGDTLGTLMGRGYDGTAQQNSTWLSFEVDGTVSAGNVPGGISVYVTPQGASTRLSTHFDASANVGIGTLTPSSKLSVEESGVRLDISPFGGATGYVGTQSNHPLGIITNNAEVIRATTDGRVGIGTTNPSGYDAKLAVFNGNLALTTTTNRLYLYYASATNHAYLSAAAGGEILFANGTASPSEKMRIDTNGNLGVGVTAPTFRFVAGNSATDGGWIYSASAVSYLGLGGYSTAGSGAFQISYDRSTGTITFNGGSRDTPAPRVTILNTGVVGINQTSPGARLHITDVDAANALLVAGPTRGLRVFSSTTGATMEGVDQTGVGSYQPLLIGGSEVRFTTSNNERMRIHASGGVSIGSSADPGANITAINATLRVLRQNTSNEGGELQFCRANDNSVSWYIDVLGSAAGTDPGAMRFVDNQGFDGGGARVRAEFSSRGVLSIVNDLGPLDTDTLAVGFRGAPHNDQTGTTYTFARTDAGRAVMFKGTASATWTIPLSTTTDFPIGTMIIVDNSHFGSGTVPVTVQGATGVGIRTTGAGEATTGRASNKQVARGGVMTLRKLANRSATQSVTSITRVGTTATMTTPAAHGYIVGDFIEVAGAAQAQYNGTQRVLTATSTTLTYAMTADPGASASGTLTVRKADLWNATGNYQNA